MVVEETSNCGALNRKGKVKKCTKALVEVSSDWKLRLSPYSL